MAQTQEEIDLVVQSTVSSIVASVRANCTLDWDIMQKGGDYIVYGVADWIENPPEWIHSTWADQARAKAALSS